MIYKSVKNKVILAITASFSALLLSACASFPESYKDDVGVPDIESEYADSWRNEPPIRYVQSVSGDTVRRYFSLPESVAKKKLSFDLNYSSNTTVGDLIYALRMQGYKVISNLGESSERQLELRKFNGTIGEFVEEIGNVQNISHEYRNGTIFFMEANRYSVSLPQHEDLLLQVALTLTEMGATDVQSDILSGTVRFSAKPDISDYIMDYLDIIAKNAAMVKLQVAVVTVGLNRDLGVGVDWSQMEIKGGGRELTPANTGDSLGGAAVDYLMGQAAGFSGGSGISYIFNNERFSLSAAIRALSTYGDAKTEQNVVLGTVSGMAVKISSGNDIPYIKSIGSTTASGGSTSGSSETEIIRSGLELVITPSFDSSDGTIITTTNVSMSSLVAFRELSAGVNLGTLSQPEMQNLEFENVGRLNAGETVVIGGITYDQLADNYTSLPGMERFPFGSKKTKVEKNAIYIVIRPTVVIYSRNANALNLEILRKKAKEETEKGLKK